MSVILAVAPHPDDETLGCGGTLLRHRRAGDAVHWLIATRMSAAMGADEARIARRAQEIVEVAARYGFAETHQLDFDATRLDAVPLHTLVDAVGAVVRRVAPEIVYLPYRRDAHTDHARVFDAVAACTKWFRYPSIHRVLAYETLSETEFQLDPDAGGFRATVFNDVTAYLDAKIDIMSVFASELGEHPFPRSGSSIRALAQLRGAAAGFEAAEAFMLLRERSRDS